MMEENKEFSKEEMEKVFREVFSGTTPFLQKQEWVEDGQICHTWKIDNGSGRIAYTNDAGAQQLQEAMRRDILNQYPDAEENTTTEKE